MTALAVVPDTTTIQDTERAVLGAVLRTSAAFDEVASILTGADFYNPNHETIWDAVAWVNRQGTADRPVRADLVLVKQRLADTGTLATVGGPAYLTACVAACVTPANVAGYAREVREAAVGRRKAALSDQFARDMARPMPAEHRDALWAQFSTAMDALSVGPGSDQLGLLSDELTVAMEALEGDGGGAVSTGLKDLDEVLGGLAPGQVVVVGARPGTGKTIMGANIVEAVARAERPAAMFTFEMSRLEMMTRLLASVCKVNSRKLNLAKPKLDDEDWEKLAGGVQKVLSLPLYVCDDSTVTPAKIDALIGAFKRKHPDLGVVVIDYLQLMKGDGRTNSRQEEVASISRAVKLMAKRHNVPVVLLSQLNRKSEERGDKKPQISDLRESGAIEQDADVVILLHREDQHDPNSERAGEMDLMVEKNRSGPSGVTVTVASQPHYFRLRDMAQGVAA